MPPSIARQLYDIYFEGTVTYAIGGLSSSGDVFYTPEEGIIDLELIEKHLTGSIVLGSYTVLPGNYVRWMAFDIDSKADPEKAKDFAKKIHVYLGKIPHAVSWSGGKGYHITLYFESPVQAKIAKQIGEDIRDLLGLPSSGDPHVEVYPKQGELNDSKKFGSLLRLPLGKHPKTGNCSIFVDPDNDWKEIDPSAVLQQRVFLKDLQKRMDDGGAVTSLIKTLSPYFTSGQRHDMALFVAGALANLEWTEEAVQDLINDIYTNVGDGNVEEWRRAVRDTFKKVHKGERVIGVQGLAKILSSESLQDFIANASKQTFSYTLKNIDAIRLGKGAAWQKVRLASKSIIAFFRENGKLVRDEDDIYWLNNETKDLLRFDGIHWSRFTHNEFGLNPIESFGRQVGESVKLYAYDEAESVKVRRRSYWDTERWWLNLGGPEVYVLNGNPDERKLAWNGDNKILFMNMTDRMHLPNIFESDVEPISPWPFLVDGLNFAPSDEVQATAVQQQEMLKAWFLMTLFAEEMPTRPLLTFLALSGSGKTSAARNILRLLEGPYEDVISVEPDKPDALRASLEAHKFVVLDNLEKTKALWLTDTLNRAATGAVLELRELHTTNRVRKIVLDNFLMMTATQMPFTEETVFTRILPIQLTPIPAFRPQHQIDGYLWSNYIGLWKGLLNDVDKVIAALKRNRESEMPIESRLADFVVFCNRIKDVDFINGKELMAGLANLVNRQKKALSETSTFVEILEIWNKARTQETVKFMSMTELYPHLQRTAHTNKIDFPWTSPQGLAKHMLMLQPILVQHYGLTVKKSIERGRETKLYKFEKITLH